MGTTTTDCNGAIHAMTSAVVAVTLLSAVTSVIHAVTDLDVGRTFILNPTFLTWHQASQNCRNEGGNLAKVDSVEVMPEMLYDEEWTLWVGLNATAQTNLTWEDGTKVSWTNWFPDVRLPSNGSSACVTATTSPPYSWSVKPCNDSYPSVCEIPGGTCRFLIIEHASIRDFNDDHTFNLDAEGCMQKCRTRRDMNCRSMEIHRDYDVCQYTNETRWTRPDRFLTTNTNWDYYHWTCINGTYLNGAYVSPNGVEIHTTEATTTAPPETTTEPTTTTTDDGSQVVCRKLKPLPENTTEELEEVKELKTLSVSIKEQSKQKKRVSTPDPRPSATYVGSLAVGLVGGVLGFIICLDLVSLPRHVKEMNRRGACCGRCAKKNKKRRKEKKDKEIRFTEYSELPARGAGSGPLVLTTKVPHNFRPNGLVRDEHVENTYCNGNGAVGIAGGSSGVVVNSKVGMHLQRIKMLQQREAATAVVVVGARRRSGKMMPPSIVADVNDNDDDRDCDNDEDDEDVDEGFSGGSLEQQPFESSGPSRVVAFVEQDEEEGNDICRIERSLDADDEETGSVAAVAGAATTQPRERNADETSSICSGDLRVDYDDEDDDDDEEDDEYYDAEGVVGELNAVVEMQRRGPQLPLHLNKLNQELCKSTRVHPLGGGGGGGGDGDSSFDDADSSASDNSGKRFDIFSVSSYTRPVVIPEAEENDSREDDDERIGENNKKKRMDADFLRVVHPARAENRLGGGEQAADDASARTDVDCIAEEASRDRFDQDCLVDIETGDAVGAAETSSPRQPDVEIRIEEAERLAAEGDEEEDAADVSSRDVETLGMDENRLSVEWSPLPGKTLQDDSGSRQAWFQ